MMLADNLCEDYYCTYFEINVSDRQEQSMVSSVTCADWQCLKAVEVGPQLKSRMPLCGR